MDQKDFRVGLWEFPNNYTSLQLGGSNYEGYVTIVKCDEYGFIVVNFKCRIPLLAESFAFPMDIEQVFFSSDVRQTWELEGCVASRAKRTKVWVH